ncbi:MAG: protein phosphatase CheZ [Thermodesulforhabdaceae bacterium]|jgi:chemotaxis regulatin CheY-phosphate phosphatase CheZ
MPIKGVPQLIDIIKRCEAIMAKVEKGEIQDKEALGQLQKLMVHFQRISEQAGLVALRRLGRELEKFVKRPDINPEELTALAFVFPTLRGGLETETIEDIRVAVLESFELLNLPVPTDWQTSTFKIVEEKPEPEAVVLQEPVSATAPEGKKEEQEIRKTEPAKGIEKEVQSVNRVVTNLGGVVKRDEKGNVTITLPPDQVAKLQRLMAPADPEMDFSETIPVETETEKEVLAKVKEFMAAFSQGDFEKAQEILEDLSQVKEGSEIFKEIGQVARQLHSAFKEFMEALDPALKELALDYLPDSESRLQHLMKLTEEAANTTLDCTERMNERNAQDLELIQRLRHHISRLKPIGKGAEERMNDIETILAKLEESRASDKNDINTILSAQNFQDLSGQTVMKVMDIMKNLQDRLVGIIKSFGLKAEKRAKKKDELYGPAHEKIEGALRSQDEVDALLAQFGF